MGYTLTDRDKPSEPYVYKAFPKHVYHADGRSTQVADDAAWIALGPGWGHPSDVPAVDAQHEPAAPTETVLVETPVPHLAPDSPRKRKARP